MKLTVTLLNSCHKVMASEEYSTTAPYATLGVGRGIPVMALSYLIEGWIREYEINLFPTKEGKRSIRITATTPDDELVVSSPVTSARYLFGNKFKEELETVDDVERLFEVQAKESGYSFHNAMSREIAPGNYGGTD